MLTHCIPGCAPGIDACFRSILTLRPFTGKSFLACAFAHRARNFSAVGLSSSHVVPGNLSAAAALHRRTTWAVSHCGLLVLFPVDPFTRRWGRGSTLAFSTAVGQQKPVFISSPTPPPASPGYRIIPSSLFGIVSGFWTIPTGGSSDE